MCALGFWGTAGGSTNTGSVTTLVPLWAFLTRFREVTGSATELRVCSQADQDQVQLHG